MIFDKVHFTREAGKRFGRNFDRTFFIFTRTLTSPNPLIFGDEFIDLTTQPFLEYIPLNELHNSI